ncbi:MAG: glycosyltransferase family 39 protein [Candidatus Omnitrophica bacterium]|nr:glycosyltransferase family 39 protein [Candidatus Omnitrophota bacterium]
MDRKLKQTKQSKTMNTIKLIKKYSLSEIFLLILIFFAVITNILFFFTDNSIKGVDSPNHLSLSLNFFYSFNSIWTDRCLSLSRKISSFVNLFYNPIENGNLCWPNGLNLSTAFFYLLMTPSLLIAKISLLPYLVILLMSTYGIGKHLFSKKAGIIAAFLVFMYPIIFKSSRQFQLDFPLTALVSLSIFFLLKSKAFSKMSDTILFSLAAACSMLIKGQTIIFLIGPFLYTIYQSISAHKITPDIKGKILRNVTLSCLCFLIIILPWWGKFFTGALSHLYNEVTVVDRATLLVGINNNNAHGGGFSYYNMGLVKAMNPLLWVTFLISLVCLIKRKNKSMPLLLGWIIIPYCFFVFTIIVKGTRYLMPLLPACAIITSGFLAETNKNRLKQLTLIAVCVLSLVYFTNDSFLKEKLRLVSLTISNNFPDTSYETIVYKRNYNMEKVCSILQAYSKEKSNILIGLIPAGDIEPFQLSCLLRFHARKFTVVNILEIFYDFRSKVNSFDFIIFHRKSTDSMPWLGGEELEKLLINSDHGSTLLFFKKQHPDWIKEILDQIKTKEKEFELIAAVTGGEERNTKCVYYIFKKIP